MNDFLYVHQKTYSNSAEQDLTLYLDVNLKKNTISNLRYEGQLAVKFREEIEEVTNTFLNQTLQSISQKIIENSLPLWLFYRTLDEYQGHVALIENKCNDLVCLCFGITQDDLRDGIPSRAGRACGSCLPYIKKREFKKIAGLYPGPLVVKLDQIIQEWAKIENTKISIEEIKDEYLDVKIFPYSRKKLHSLSEYLLEKLNTRFFLRGTL